MNLKNILKTTIMSLVTGSMLMACSDILEGDSDLQAFEPTLNQKTDSMFYAFGIAQAMQQLADQYVFLGEMRGDLVELTNYTDSALRQLATFDVSPYNPYDSTYLYYRVINNCNYYIAHRDTTLITADTEVAMNEYAAVKSVRAWAYLQLVLNYGKVPFVDKPITKISQVEEKYDSITLDNFISKLVDGEGGLASYTGRVTPNYGNVTINAGNMNSGGSKNVFSWLLLPPVDVVLGDIYLETGNPMEAAKHYIKFMTEQATSSQRHSFFEAPGTPYRVSTGIFENTWPADYDSEAMLSTLGSSWSSIFSGNSDRICYIPLAVNYMRGQTTSVPQAFGYDFYAYSTTKYIDEIQILPSKSYLALSDSTDYYYFSTLKTTERDTINHVKVGDMRVNSCINTYIRSDVDSLQLYVNKYDMANVNIYRASVIWLRLAEAWNQLGYYDLAFAILKDGISDNLQNATYISDDHKALLSTTFPLLPLVDNSAKFSPEAAYGIHAHGAGRVRDHTMGYASGKLVNGAYKPNINTYRPDTIIGLKLKEIATKFGVAVGTTKQDTINAMEDIICDELALEAAFEGNRYNDLLRMARRKNRAGLYGANFGSQWLVKKLEYKSPNVQNLLDPNKWYLPFK